MEMLNIEQIEKILPQRYPFLLIDRVIMIEAGEKVIAIKNLTINDRVFQGHFPGNPVMPGTLIIEAMAQTSIVLYYSKFKDVLEKTPSYYLGSIKSRFKNPVVPGDQLRLEAYGEKLIATAAVVNVKAFVGDKEIAETELIFSIKR